ncbi:hypothetical protein BJ878DRAFT_519451 [Calycina marina]|uniref:OTU domain-containing protein n=1 Tax=Calycina marina TaxID=1763456 RepID=A0A9P7YXT5_9HELO|nr:hypothetical protein BJ878DRAFT_519451 [Calycina marina]
MASGRPPRPTRKARTKNAAIVGMEHSVAKIRVIRTRSSKALEDFPLLDAEGYTIKRIKNDGNCLFRAMSDQIFDREEDYIAVRQAAVKQMRAESHEYTPFIDYRAKGMAELRRGEARGSRASSQSSFSVDEPPPTDTEKEDIWETYLTRMAKNREWGDHLEIKAIARAYNVDVKVYIQRGVESQHLGQVVFGGELGLERPITRIAFHGWRHFSSVRARLATY